MPRVKRTVQEWRREVLRSHAIGDGTRVLLLLMADRMTTDRKVSVPRADLARALDRSERRITSRITEAHDAGFLSTVVRGQKGVTAVYEGLFPDPFSGTDGVPLNEPEKAFSETFSGTHTRPLKGAETVPLNEPNQAFSGTPGGPTNRRADLSSGLTDRNGGSKENHDGPDRPSPAHQPSTVCQWHDWPPCPSDCANYVEESA